MANSFGPEKWAKKTFIVVRHTRRSKKYDFDVKLQNHFARKLLKMHVRTDVYVSIHFVMKSAIIPTTAERKALVVRRMSKEWSADNTKESRAFRGVPITLRWKQFKLFVFYWRTWKMRCWGWCGCDVTSLKKIKTGNYNFSYLINVLDKLIAQPRAQMFSIIHQSVLSLNASHKLKKQIHLVTGIKISRWSKT